MSTPYYDTPDDSDACFLPISDATPHELALYRFQLARGKAMIDATLSPHAHEPDGRICCDPVCKWEADRDRSMRHASRALFASEVVTRDEGGDPPDLYGMATDLQSVFGTARTIAAGFAVVAFLAVGVWVLLKATGVLR